MRVVIVSVIAAVLIIDFPKRPAWIPPDARTAINYFCPERQLFSRSPPARPASRAVTDTFQSSNQRL